MKVDNASLNELSLNDNFSLNCAKYLEISLIYFLFSVLTFCCVLCSVFLFCVVFCFILCFVLYFFCVHFVLVCSVFLCFVFGFWISHVEYFKDKIINENCSMNILLNISFCVPQKKKYMFEMT